MRKMRRNEDDHGKKRVRDKNMILETAVQLAKEEGIENVTARKLANKIGCSTQPIFRVYANMTELYTEVYQKAIDLFADYYENSSPKCRHLLFTWDLLI